MLAFATFACGCAPNINWFLASRFLQGLGESLEPVIYAACRDYFSKPEEPWLILAKKPWDFNIFWYIIYYSKEQFNYVKYSRFSLRTSIFTPTILLWKPGCWLFFWPARSASWSSPVYKSLPSQGRTLADGGAPGHDVSLRTVPPLRAQTSIRPHSVSFATRRSQCKILFYRECCE